MEATPLLLPGLDDWASRFTAALGAQRARVRDFLGAQQARLTQAEAQLETQLQLLCDALSHETQQSQLTRRELEQRQAEIAQELAGLERLRAQVATRQADWEQLYERSTAQQAELAAQCRGQQDEIDRQRAEVERQRAEIERQRAELAAAEETLAAKRAKLADEQRASEEALAARHATLAEGHAAAVAARAELDAQRAELEARARHLTETEQQLLEKLAAVADREAQTVARRHRLARELAERHATQLRELARCRAELDRRDTAERDDLRQRLVAAEAAAAARAETVESLRAEVSEWQAQASAATHEGDAAAQATSDALQTRRALDEANAELVRLRAAVQTAQEQAAESDRTRHERDEATSELANLRRALQAAQAEAAAGDARAAELEAKLATAAQKGPAHDGESDDYRRRYELALDDLKQLKARNAELQQELGQAKAARPAEAKAPAGGVLNWELEKQRILAALESDNASDSTNERDRLEIRQIVARTDQVLADKDRELAERDREIEELKHLLDNQSGSVGAVAVGAAAFGALLDNDAVIQDHRRHLEQLQAELEGKLRQAEIEISLERATLARDRAKLEEQLRDMETAQPGGPTAAATKDEKPTRGRWLARLGLKGDEG